jgi:hypothetical protein
LNLPKEGEKKPDLGNVKGKGGVEENGYGAEGKLFSKKDSEIWHGWALRMATTFLPGECPLVVHVISSYMKHHLKPKVSQTLTVSWKEEEKKRKNKKKYQKRFKKFR